MVIVFVGRLTYCMINNWVLYIQPKRSHVYGRKVLIISKCNGVGDWRPGAATIKIITFYHLMSTTHPRRKAMIHTEGHATVGLMTNVPPQHLYLLSVRSMQTAATFPINHHVPTRLPRPKPHHTLSHTHFRTRKVSRLDTTPSPGYSPAVTPLRGPLADTVGIALGLAQQYALSPSSSINPFVSS
jgi:hypothetical protein